MMVGLVDKSLFCGGTIISNYHVLTTAHCLSGKDPNSIKVLIGDYDLSTGWFRF